MHHIFLARRDPKAVLADPDPGYEARAMGALAHGAMTMAGEQRGQFERKGDGAAKTTPGDGLGLHVINLSTGKTWIKSIERDRRPDMQVENALNTPRQDLSPHSVRASEC
jgi:hypothetical protein